MQNTGFQTLDIQAIGSTTPTTLFKSPWDFPMRVLVSNVGVVVIFVSAEVGDLAPRPTVASYRVFPGEEHVFVLAPKQAIYAVGNGTGGRMSVSPSEALPIAH